MLQYLTYGRRGGTSERDKQKPVRLEENYRAVWKPHEESVSSGATAKPYYSFVNQNKANNKTNKKPYLFLKLKIIVSVIFIFQYNNYKTIRSFCINYTNQILNTRGTTQRFNHNIRNSKLSEYNNLLFNSFTSCFYENRNLYDSFNTDLLYVYRNNHYI